MSSLMGLFSLACALIKFRCSRRKLEAKSEKPKFPTRWLTFCMESMSLI